jgi:cell division protein FtsB
MIRRVLFPGLVAAALYFALFGGQYSVFEVSRVRADTVRETAELHALRLEADSLRARADSLENHDATLERVARERFGMIRPGDVLYRFAEPIEGEEGGERRGGG